MLKRVFILPVLFVVVLLSSCNSRDDKRVNNIEAFAQTYGLVRWFYPGDEAQQVDWNKLAAYGVEQVADCGSSEELKQKLEELFTPIAPGIRFSDSARYDALHAITPPDTTAMSVVAWQHYGVDLGLWSGEYVSKRTNRALHTPNRSKLAIDGQLPAAVCLGSEVTISAEIKNNTPDDLKIFFRTTLDKDEARAYIFFCVADSTLKPIHNHGEWQIYTCKIEVEPVYANSLIHYGIYADGEGDFSVRNIRVISSEHGNLSSDCSELWNPTVYNYNVCKNQYNISTKGELFESRNHFGDVVTRELASDLYVHVPLALYGTKEMTYPVADSGKLVHLQKEIEATTPSDWDLMAADILVAWNVINYFHPHLSDQDIVWSEELSKALNRTFEFENYDSRPIKLMTAQLNDAHVWHYMPDDYKPETVKYLPFRVRKIDDKLVITHTVDSLFRAGDIIESVNGENALAGYQYIEEEISGHVQYKAARAEEAWLQSFAENDTVALAIRRNKKCLNVVTSLLVRDTYLYALTHNGKESKWIDSKTLYLNLSNTNFYRVREFLLAEKAGTECYYRYSKR